MYRKLLRLSFLAFTQLAVCLSIQAHAQEVPHDPLDPNDIPTGSTAAEIDENFELEKSSEELIREAELLFIEERLLDGRTKLLQAIKKDPKNHQAHSLLAGYYLVHVGHFKLALRYIREAQKLFQEQHGPPPYEDYLLKATHAHQLNLLSQARLNLDDYRGALAALDEYEQHNYYQGWYPGTRAWVLMKNGQLDEAIRVARLGVITGAEPGRTLNILGILLSMTGERQASLDVFQQAITHEYSLGSYGQPSTPLNNSGEVYREIFQEDAAERAWMQATSLPDGCEHVLPALNLATVRIEHLDFRGASSALDNFESCVAQFPLRNGEEHKALVHLARGRIDLHTGKIEDGIAHLQAALKRQQWFGKIGTDVEDLQAGALASLAFAFLQKARRDQVVPLADRTWLTMPKIWLEKQKLHLQAWWTARRVLQLFIDKLNFGEDFYIRNTDSMLEYSNLGTALSYLPPRTLDKRLQLEAKSDERGPAYHYYQAYRGENLLSHGRRSDGVAILREVKRNLRLPADGALKVHVLLTLASAIKWPSSEYRSLVNEAFLLNRASIPSYGLKLPVNFSSSDPYLSASLNYSPFLVDEAEELEYLISHGRDGNMHSLRFGTRSSGSSLATVTGEDFEEVLRKLADEVFQSQS